MGIEIERKFLVQNDSWRDQVIYESRLQQGYICNQSNTTVRVRIGKGKAILNIKSATVGIRRSEFEYEIPLQEGEAILESVARKPIIDKVRYKVRHGAHVWDLDVFGGENQGLIVAEVELASEDESFDKPGWAGNEVSGDARYYNASLVTCPYSQWTK